MAPITIVEAMQIAIGHHRAGRLAEAGELYRRILAASSDHVDALHLLGVLTAQEGDMERGIDLIGRAIGVNPAVALFHNSLGETCRKAGQFERAIASLRRAIALKPDLAEAHHNLGNALKDAGRLDEAIDAYRRAIPLRPDHAEAHHNLGSVLRDRGRLDEAIDAFRRAVALEPDLAEFYSNLGVALHESGRLDEAIDAQRRAIAIKPELAEAHNNLGNALWELGRLDEAIAALGRALHLRPGFVQGHNNLGNALKDKGRLDEAIAAYRHAIALDPDFAGAYSNLGNALREASRLDEAIAAQHRAIALRPDHAVAHNSLGNVFKDQGRLDEALAAFRAAVEVKPDFATAASNVLCTLHYHPGYDASAILAEHRAWARRFADPLSAQARPHANDRAPDRRLRVGFVSPDLRAHPVGLSLVSLFEHLDRRQFEVVCYSDVRASDRVAEQLRALADDWRDTVGLGDAPLAERVRGDGIDILVDLALHTAGNRMLAFARRPAPVQATMLGMPATTGLDAIDYRLTDRYLDPPGGEADYAERSIRLPHSFWCYRPPEGTPPVGALPALANGFVTFGCLNNFAKVTRPALALWVNILLSVPASRLVIQCQPGGHREAVRALFADAGIAPGRVAFVPKVSQTQYFALYQGLDLSLDPFPYNGHTSALDSLWMGVPVITLAGGTAVGRGGVSILSNLGLPELIAGDPREYVEIAAGLAGDLARLAALRAGLRERLRGSSLMDGERYAADVGSAFRRMWGAWCGR